MIGCAKRFGSVLRGRSFAVCLLLLAIFVGGYAEEAGACAITLSFVDQDYAEVDELASAPREVTNDDTNALYAFRVKVPVEIASSGAASITLVIDDPGDEDPPEEYTVTLQEAGSGALYRYTDLIVLVNVSSEETNHFVAKLGDKITAQLGSYSTTTVDTTYIQEPPRNAIMDGYGVFVHNGEFVETATDLSMVGVGMDFAFARTYRSYSDYDGPLGHKWDFNYNMRLTKIKVYHDYDGSSTSSEGPQNEVIRLYSGNGRVDQYSILPVGEYGWYDPDPQAGTEGWVFYKAPNGIYDEIVEVVDTLGTNSRTDDETQYFILRTKHRTDYGFSLDGEEEEITGATTAGHELLQEIHQKARLTGITDRNYNFIAIYYENCDPSTGKIDYIMDTRGVHMKFKYNGERIEKIFIDEGDGAGGDPNGQIDADEYFVWSYYYDSNGDLYASEGPEGVIDGTSTRLAIVYKYNADHYLTDIYAPNNTELSGGTWQAKSGAVAALHNDYHTSGVTLYKKVWKQTFGGDATCEFDYSSIGEYKITVNSPVAFSGENSNAKTVYELNHSGTPYQLGIVEKTTTYEDTESPVQECISEFQYNSDMEILHSYAKKKDVGGETETTTGHIEYTYDTTTYDPSASNRIIFAGNDFSNLSRGNQESAVLHEVGGSGTIETAYGHTDRYNFVTTVTEETGEGQATSTASHDDKGNVTKVEGKEVTVGMEGSQNSYRLVTERGYYGGSGEKNGLLEFETAKVQKKVSGNWENLNAATIINKTVYDYWVSTDTGHEKDAKRLKSVERYVSDPGGANEKKITIQYTQYDTKGRLTKEVDARGIETTYEYDKKGRKISIKYATTKPAGIEGSSYEVKLEYDGNDNLTHKKTQKATAGWHVTEYQYYNNGNRKRTILDPGGLKLTTDYIYDENGFLTHTIKYKHPGSATATKAYIVKNVLNAVADIKDRIIATGTYTPPVLPADPNVNNLAIDNNDKFTTSYKYGWAFIKSETDFKGNETTFVYDKYSRKVATISPKENFIYNGSTVNRHLVRCVEYDDAGNRKVVAIYAVSTPPANADAVETLMNSSANLVSKTAFAYDQLNRTYSSTEFLFTEAAPATQTGLTTYYYYWPGNADENAKWRSLAKTKDPTNVESCEWSNMLGHTVKEYTGGGSDYISYEYDANGNQIRTITSDGGSAYYASAQFDCHNRLITFADQGTDNRDYANIDWAKAKGRTDADYKSWHVSEYTFDNRNLRESLTDPKAIQTEWSYDEAGRLGSKTEHRSAGGNAVTEYLYHNHTGKLNVIKDAEDSKTFLEYGAIGRPKTIAYGASVNASQQLTGCANKIVFAYDDANHVKTVYAKDAQDNTKREVITVYDKFDRTTKDYLKSGTWCGIRARTSTYDGLGRKIGEETYTTVDGSGTPSGLQTLIENSYNSLRLLSQKQGVDLDKNGSIADGEKKTVSYNTYDGAGRLEAFTYPSSRGISLVRDTDALRRIRKVRQTSGTAYDIATYDYLGAARLKERVYNNGTKLTIGNYNGTNNTYQTGYDGFRRVKEFYNWKGTPGTETNIVKFEYAYDKNSNRVYERRDGATKADFYAYDDQNHLVKAKYGATIPGGFDPDNFSIDGLEDWSRFTTFNLDKVGNRTTVADDTDGAEGADPQTTTYYDADEGTTTGGDTLNQYRRIGLPDSSTLNRDHDEAGNLTDEKSSDKVRYGWDYFDRLVLRWDDADSDGVLDVNAGGTPTENVYFRYIYDARGRRVLKYVYEPVGTAATLAIRYIYNGWQCIEEYEDDDGDGSGGWSANPVKQYVYGNSIDEILQLTTGGQKYYYHANVQSNTVALTKQDGAVVEEYEYDIYGRLTDVWAWKSGSKVHVVDGDFNGDGDNADPGESTDGFIDREYFARSDIDNPYLFQGRRYDEESALYYFRNRYYDPEHGRFISRNPEGYEGGLNLYAFVNNSPVTYVVPEGLLMSSQFNRMPDMAKIRTTMLRQRYAFIMLALAAVYERLNVEIGDKTTGVIKYQNTEVLGTVTAKGCVIVDLDEMIQRKKYKDDIISFYREYGQLGRERRVSMPDGMSTDTWVRVKLAGKGYRTKLGGYVGTSGTIVILIKVVDAYADFKHQMTTIHEKAHTVQNARKMASLGINATQAEQGVNDVWNAKIEVQRAIYGPDGDLEAIERAIDNLEQLRQTAAGQYGEWYLNQINRSDKEVEAHTIDFDALKNIFNQLNPLKEQYADQVTFAKFIRTSARNTNREMEDLQPEQTIPSRWRYLR